MGTKECDLSETISDEDIQGMSDQELAARIRGGAEIGVQHVRLLHEACDRLDDRAQKVAGHDRLHDEAGVYLNALVEPHSEASMDYLYKTNEGTEELTVQPGQSLPSHVEVGDSIVIRRPEEHRFVVEVVDESE